MPDTPRYGGIFLAALISVTFVGPLSVHLYLPALPSVQAAFAISPALAQLTLTVALLAMGCSMLIYGSLSDRFGRRPVLLAGLSLFALGALACWMAPDLESLMAGRLVQAAGGACGVVLARAMIRDVFGVEKLTRYIAYLTMAYVLGPMLAPVAGGALIDALGWRAIFVFAAAVGAVLVVVALLFLPETHTGRGPRAGASILRGYLILLRNPSFAGYVLHVGFAAGTFFAYISSASYLMSSALQRPASDYGLYFLMMPSAYVTGNFIASRLTQRFRPEIMVLAGSVATLIMTLAGVIMFAWVELTPFLLFLPGVLLTLGHGLSLPNAQSGAIAADAALTGTASGLVMFSMMFMGGLLSQFAGSLADGTTGPMGWLVTAGAVLALVAGIVPYLHQRNGK